MKKASRVFIDCRDFPNEIGCTLLITGNPKEVFKTALRHSTEDHGHKDTQELRKQLKGMMKANRKPGKSSKSYIKKGIKK